MPHTAPDRVYLAGELFSAKHLLGNAALAAALTAHAGDKFTPVLPQDLEPRDFSPHTIRDTDLLALLSCHLAVFHFDGTELDSGTVVEFMTAKFADIPAVLLRTDFRPAGDQGQGGDPWNLMCSFFPRSRTVSINALIEYKTFLTQTSGNSVEAARLLVDKIAHTIADALTAVRDEPPALPQDLAPPVYDWLARFANLQGDPAAHRDTLRRLLAEKRDRKLL